MKKLTVFTAPKPFTDPHINVIQRNAIGSWLQMGEDVEVILIGDEVGIAEVSNDLGVTRISNVKQNRHGTPLVSSIFQLAGEKSASELLLFANTDMLFFPETLDIANGMKGRADDFVLLGQRYDLDVTDEIDFSIDWEASLLAAVRARGKLHPLGGSDYFIFPKHMFTKIPNFAIGRAGWDNWMIYHALSEGWMVVDITPSLMAVHQNHSYSHLESERGHQRHPETQENLELAGGMRKMFSLLDVKYQMVGGKITPIPWSIPRILNKIERRLQPVEMVGRGPGWWLLRGIRKLRRSLQRSEAD
jgi:hypothetical protein